MKIYYIVYINGIYGNVIYLINIIFVIIEIKVCFIDVFEGLCRFFDDFKFFV